MDNAPLFSEFTNQSKKGIVVIYCQQLYSLLKTTWILLFLFIQKFSKIPASSLLFIYLGIVALLLILLISAYLVFKNFQFKIANKHFILKKGIFKKTTIEIPFERIQNINFKQNIIQQIINVYEVNIETAGSTEAEISIKAMTFEQANALKKSLTTFTSSQTQSEIEIQQKPLLKLDLLTLLKVSITENHLQSLLVLFALLVGFYQQLDQFFGNSDDKTALKTIISNNTSAFQSSIFIISIFSISLIFLGILSSFVRIIFHHFNLTVFIKNDTLEIDQGLTTKKSMVLKKNKVQHITLSTNPIKKMLGIFFITFTQAESGITTEKKQATIKIVGCKMAQIKAIKQLLFPNDNLSDFQKNNVASYYKTRWFFRAFLLLLLINIGCYFAFKNPQIIWINAFLIPIFIFLIKLKFKKRTYLFSNDLLEINFGIIETHQTILPFYKVQNVCLKQSFFQAKKNVADLVFQTASGKVTIPCISLTNAQKIYNFTLNSIETNQQSWM